MTQGSSFVWLADRSTRDNEGCLVWGGTLQPNGYGRATIPGVSRREYVHRLAYEMCVGALVKGLEIDHVCHDVRTCTPPCKHRACVEPTHLRQVTHQENTSRSFRLVEGRLTCSRRGHDLSTADAVLLRGTSQSPTCAACWNLSRERFASRTASGESTPYWKTPRPCAVCSKDFVPKKRTTRTCSRAHANQLMWAARRAKTTTESEKPQ